jgi:hypothetical protein
MCLPVGSVLRFACLPHLGRDAPTPRKIDGLDTFVANIGHHPYPSDFGTAHDGVLRRWNASTDRAALIR